MHSFLKAVIYLSLLALYASACGEKKTLQASTLQIAINASPESLDPRFATSYVAGLLSQLTYAPLCIINDQLIPEPFLAETITQTSDTTYLIKLRQNLRFHNGQSITSQDVVYTFQSLVDNHIHSPLAEDYQKRIASIKALNHREVQIILKAPLASFLANQICNLGILSKTHCESKNQCTKNHMGSGPFRLEQWNQTTDTYTFQSHGGWFEGKPPIERMVVRVIKDATTRFLELIHKKIDLMVGGIPPPFFTIVSNYDYIQMLRQPGLSYTYLAFNMRGTASSLTLQESEQDRAYRALANPKVRRAIAHAIDADRMIQTKLRGFAKRASGLIPSGHWAKSDKVQSIPYNPKKAKQLLDEAGFLDRGALGRFHIILSTSTDRFRQSLSQICVRQLQQVGIQTSIRVQDWGALYQDMKKGNFQMFTAAWTPVIEPDLLHWVFHSDSIPLGEKGGGNRGGYKDPTIDQWITEAQMSTEQEKRKNLYEKIELLLLETMPYAPLWFEDETVLINKRLSRYHHARTGSLIGLRKATLQ